MDIRGRWHDMLDATLYLGRGSVIAHSMSAIEIALWDVRGRAEGRPVWRLLAPGLASPVGPRAYGTVLAPKNEAQLLAVREMAEAESLVGIKVAWGGGDPVPGGDEVAHLKQIRRVIGPDLEIRVDLCCSWREDALAKPLNEYAALGVRWLEEPFAPERLDLCAALAERCEVPIAAGENESTLDGFKALVDAGVRVLQPDVSRCGGLCAAQEVAALARQRGVQCVPHVWSTGINVAATVHWAIATGSPLVERTLGTSPLHRELVLNVPALTNGRFEIPVAPGLGIDLDQDQVERYLDHEPGGRTTGR